jgi:nucleotide-binding universal stress UspA family protein
MIVLKNILVATDFGPAADTALAYGRALATQFGARLHVLHVAEDHFLRPSAMDPAALSASARCHLEARLTAEDRGALRAQAVLERSDRPASTITAYASRTGIDVIVMGTHGRTDMIHVLMGSVAEQVVRTAPCPVLTVQHPEREFVMPRLAAVAVTELRTS